MAATPGIAALVKAGVPHEVLTFQHNRREQSFGAQAVKALTEAAGIESGQIFKTLIVAVPDGLAVAIVPVTARLSLKAAAVALGVAKASMAEAPVAERTTGYVVGAVSPFGQRRKLPTVVDSSALAWDRVYCSAGRRGWEVALAPQDLIRITGAITADITGM